MEKWRHEDMDTWRHGHEDMDTWRHWHEDMETSNVKRKIKAQMIFLHPYIVYSTCKQKFVVCPFADEEKNWKYMYLFANGLNEVAHLWNKYTFPTIIYIGCKQCEPKTWHKVIILFSSSGGILWDGLKEGLELLGEEDKQTAIKSKLNSFVEYLLISNISLQVFYSLVFDIKLPQFPADTVHSVIVCIFFKIFKSKHFLKATSSNELKFIRKMLLTLLTLNMCLLLFVFQYCIQMHNFDQSVQFFRKYYLFHVKQICTLLSKCFLIYELINYYLRYLFSCCGIIFYSAYLSSGDKTQFSLTLSKLLFPI
jgi:hypothetical protein